MGKRMAVGGRKEEGGVLLAVGVIYHAVDMDLFAHVHGEDEGEPAGAEVGAGLDPAETWKIKKSFVVIFICINKKNNSTYINITTSTGFFRILLLWPFVLLAVERCL